MLDEVELYVYDKYIKGMVVEKNGVNKISKEELEKLTLSPHEKNFIMYIINKKKIKVTDEKITRADRSPYVRDNNYGEIKGNDLQRMDTHVFGDYEQLDEYLETRFIPAYVLLKRGKNSNGETELFPSIRLHHIMALKLSEAELEHVMNYLNERGIRVRGKGATLAGEFENYDYVTTYKESALPQSVAPDVTLQNIKLYKQNKDLKLRQQIITDNMRLVPYVAFRYAMSTGINRHELESYGYEGLIMALESFDVNYDNTFATYAVANIRSYILDGIQEILIGKRDRNYYDYVNAKAAVEKESGVTLAEAPELLEDVIDLLVATGKVKGNEDAIARARMKIRAMAIGNPSLDDPEVVEELITSDQLLDPHDYAEEVLNTVSSEELVTVLDVLTPREATIIRLRYGIDDGEPKTLEEIGKVFHISKDRVRTIELKALHKLRHPRFTRLIRDFYEDSDTEKYIR